MVSPTRLIFFPFHGRRAGRAEGAGRGGSRQGSQQELVLLSSLLTVRRLLAGTAGGIKLGQQLASREQNRVLTGCFPARDYQYGVLGIEVSLRSPCLCRPLLSRSPSLWSPPVALGLSSLRRGKCRRTTQDTWLLTGIQETLCPQRVSAGWSRNQCDAVCQFSASMLPMLFL